MRDEEKKRLIELAGEYIQLRANPEDIEDPNIKNYMKQIAANAVLINLYDTNHIIVSNICDGDFDSVQEYKEEIIDRLVKCLTIICRKGDRICDLLGVEEINDAINYTIFEKIDENEG